MIQLINSSRRAIFQHQNWPVQGIRVPAEELYIIWLAITTSARVIPYAKLGRPFLIDIREGIRVEVRGEPVPIQSLGEGPRVDAILPSLKVNRL